MGYSGGFVKSFNILASSSFLAVGSRPRSPWQSSLFWLPPLATVGAFASPKRSQCTFGSFAEPDSYLMISFEFLTNMAKLLPDFCKLRWFYLPFRRLADQSWSLVLPEVGDLKTFRES